MSVSVIFDKPPPQPPTITIAASQNVTPHEPNNKYKNRLGLGANAAVLELDPEVRIHVFVRIFSYISLRTCVHKNILAPSPTSTSTTPPQNTHRAHGGGRGRRGRAPSGARRRRPSGRRRWPRRRLSGCATRCVFSFSCLSFQNSHTHTYIYLTQKHTHMYIHTHIYLTQTHTPTLPTSTL